MNPMQLTLGIITAAGGFIDISNVVFNSEAGAKFGYSLLWTVIVGAIGIAVYSEMCGRIAAIADKPVFDLIRERTGFAMGLTTLVAANIVNLLTCAAEVGGVAIVLQLFSGIPYFFMLVLAVLLLLLTVWMLKFELIERVFGIMGLFMFTFAAAAIWLHPDWMKVGFGLIPSMPKLSGSQTIDYWYFAVGVLSSVLMPYEVYFYSSGGIEEHWQKKDLLTNKLTSYIGYGIGSLLAIAITILGAQLMFPRGIDPQLLSTSLLGPIAAFGKVGLFLALIGLLFAIGGAAIEASFAGAYSVSQFFGWEWGRFQEQHKAPRFTLGWIIMFLLAMLIDFTGINPVQITQYAVIFSVVALPFTYIPIFLVANDKFYLGKFVNGKITNILGWIYLVIILVVAIAAIPLLILSKGGQA